jgi:CxxC-x17-CxxC domain-containing protein
MDFDRSNDRPNKNFAPREQREMVKGDWECSECGAKITELPFEPAPDRPIYCRDCWRNRRDRKFGGR